MVGISYSCHQDGEWIFRARLALSMQGWFMMVIELDLIFRNACGKGTSRKNGKCLELTTGHRVG
ncbi:MAG: hypothetical protein QXP01_04920 [Candidatus Hadarchaeum sp.]